MKNFLSNDKKIMMAFANLLMASIICQLTKPISPMGLIGIIIEAFLVIGLLLGSKKIEKK